MLLNFRGADSTGERANLGKCINFLDKIRFADCRESDIIPCELLPTERRLAGTGLRLVSRVTGVLRSLSTGKRLSSNDWVSGKRSVPPRRELPAQGNGDRIVSFFVSRFVGPVVW